MAMQNFPTKLSTEFSNFHLLSHWLLITHVLSPLPQVTILLHEYKIKRCGVAIYKVPLTRSVDLISVSLHRSMYLLAVIFSVVLSRSWVGFGKDDSVVLFSLFILIFIVPRLVLIRQV